MMVKIETLKQMVVDSAKQLDKDIPTWWAIVDSFRLNMGEPQLCICGQLREYFRGKEEHFHTYDDLGILAYSFPRAFHLSGLDIDFGDYYLDRGKDGHAELSKLWKAEIFLRLL